MKLSQVCVLSVFDLLVMFPSSRLFGDMIVFGVGAGMGGGGVQVRRLVLFCFAR